jgi:hypothetical protein
MRTTRTLSSVDLWYSSNFQAGITGVVLGLLGAVIVYALIKSRSTGEVAKALLAGAVTVFVALAAMAAGLLAT